MKIKDLTLKCLCLLVLLSCNKVEKHKPKIELDEIKEQVRSNPFEDYGKQHNEWLIEIENLRNESLDKSKSSAEDLINRLIIIAENRFGTEIDLSYEQVKNRLQEIKDHSVTSYAQLLRLNNKISVKGEGYLIRLDQILNNENVNSIDSQIENLEFEINREISLDPVEKEKIFIAMAVAKSSNEFWGSNENTFLNGGFKASCKKRFCIAGLDVIGALIGVFTPEPIIGSIVFAAIASAYGKCCLCCPESCPNVEGLC